MTEATACFACLEDFKEGEKGSLREEVFAYDSRPLGLRLRLKSCWRICIACDKKRLENAEFDHKIRQFEVEMAKNSFKIQEIHLLEARKQK